MSSARTLMTWVHNTHDQLVGLACQSCSTPYPSHDTLLARTTFLHRHTVFQCAKVETTTKCDICFNSENKLFEKKSCECKIDVCLQCSSRLENCPMCRRPLFSSAPLTTLTLEMIDEESTREDDESTATASSSQDEQDTEDDDRVVMRINTEVAPNVPLMLPLLETPAERIARLSLDTDVILKNLRHDLVCKLTSSMAYDWVRDAYSSSAVVYSWRDISFQNGGSVTLSITHTILRELFKTFVRGVRALCHLNKVKRHLPVLKLAHVICLTLRKQIQFRNLAFTEKLEWLEENDIINAAISMLRRFKRCSLAHERVLTSWDDILSDSKK